jgi:hypothetical protein
VLISTLLLPFLLWLLPLEPLAMLFDPSFSDLLVRLFNTRRILGEPMEQNANAVLVEEVQDAISRLSETQSQLS